MKKGIYLFAILIATLNSCSKEEIVASPFLGTYKGYVIDSNYNASGTYIDTIKDYTIIITASSTNPDQVYLHNELIETKAGIITGNIFTIEKRLVSQDIFFHTYEWAEGSFSETGTRTLTANFYRELVSENKVAGGIKRSCLLVQQ